jgi:hypothetical protein
MNEAAITAAREDRTEITQYDLLRSIEKVMLGPERRSHVLNRREKKSPRITKRGTRSSPPYFRMLIRCTKCRSSRVVALQATL